MKITDYPSYSNPVSSDILLIVVNVGDDPASKQISVKNLFGNVRSNAKFTATAFTVNSTNVTISGNTLNVTVPNVDFNFLNVDNLKVTSNGFIITNKYTPANSSVSEASSMGKISFDNNYLYVKTANNVTKRVALSSF